MTSSKSKMIVFGSMLAWVLLGLVSAIPAMFAAMMFDSPGSASNLATVGLVTALMSCPFVCALTVANVWKAHRAGKHSTAYRWACLPLANLLVAAAACVWIQFFQGGKFSG